MITNLSNTPPFWVDTPSTLNQLIDTLQTQQIIAVDTESDSLYSYFEKVCLIQFSTNEADYLVDPLNVDVANLAPVFANPNIEKVFHAADYDIACLKRDYGFQIINLFDTMVAARVLGWSQVGLAAILKERFEVTVNKKFQKYNWGERPIKSEALNYARLDTHYLIPLQQIQRDELLKRKRLQHAQDSFKRAESIQASEKRFDPNDFWRIKGVKSLPPQQQAILRELFILRDSIARKVDRPPFKVMSNNLLMQLAQEQPEHNFELAHLKGANQALLQEHRNELFQAIKTGQHAPHPKPRRRKSTRPDDETLKRYEAMRHWRNNIAKQHNVAPDMVANNQSLMRIARANPTSVEAIAKASGLTDWQIQTYGDGLLTILKNS